ncbi:LPXTG cell wall anchor domain-containing protein [Haloglycomyces albus]|uniref:LPXTG cell wall anchor domain-containing protein n=1 Tax=Haloglycomyces albus TaxID=526067 RepID=UPI00046CD211|nr:LPXTG cell wall anchor domain-containing protein [Haloglycomyces albus]
MNTKLTTSSRHLSRAAAALTIAAVTSAGLTAPALAQDSDFGTADLVWDEIPLDSPGDYTRGTFDIEADLDKAPSDAPIELNFNVDAPSNTFAVTYNYGFGECEEDDNSLNCIIADPAAFMATDFKIEAVESLKSGSYPYTASVQWGESTLLDTTDAFDIKGQDLVDARHPFTHGEFEHSSAQPGEIIDVDTPFRLDRAVPDGPNVVAVDFSIPFSRVGQAYEGADPIAEYDNCENRDYDNFNSIAVTCYIADQSWQQGTTYSIDDATPVTYEIADDALGTPWEVCGCFFSASFIKQETMDELTVNLDGSHQLRIAETDTQVERDGEMAQSFGPITITVPEHPFELEVSPFNIEGETGETVDVTIPVTNNGPAKAIQSTWSNHSYWVPIQLPNGTEVAEFSDNRQDEHFCDLEFGQYIENERFDLEEYDLVCFFDEIEVGATIDVEFSVTITDDEPATNGSFYVLNGRDFSQEPHYETNLDNNSAVIGLNSPDILKDIDESNDNSDLPVTGSALTYGIIGGAAALLSGAVLFFVARRRTVR